MIPIDVHVDICVFYKIEALDVKTQKMRLLADFFPNIMLNSGLNVLDTQAGWFNYCQVGTSDTAPSALQTSLQGWVAGTNTLWTTTVTGAEATPPYYGSRQKVFEFPEAVAAYNLNEVGVGWNDGSNPAINSLVSRSLIVDINGVRTTPTWKIGEVLIVTAEMRYYPPLSDVTGTVDLNGVTYDYTLRASEATSSSAWGSGIGDLMGQVSAIAADWRVYSGDISADITGLPAGTTADCDNASQYNIDVPEQYTVGMGCNCGPTGWNIVGGFQSLRFKTTAGNYQIQFDGPAGAKVPKTIDFTMFFQFNLTWAGKVIT